VHIVASQYNLKQIDVKTHDGWARSTFGVRPQKDNARNNVRRLIIKNTCDEIDPEYSFGELTEALHF
jgi:hypothetical protein